MKQWLLLVVFILVLGVVLLFVLTPARGTLYQTSEVTVNARAFTRTFLQERSWTKWWPTDGTPSDKNTAGPHLVYNGNRYVVSQQNLTSVVLSIHRDSDSVRTELFFIPQNDNTVKLIWEGSITYPANPVERLRQTTRTKTLNRDLGSLLQHVQQFYGNEDNLYGRQIRRERVQDSLLISTTLKTTGYPKTEQIYSLIDKLKGYLGRNGAVQTGRPMLHVKTDDSIRYFARVALPVNKPLKDSGGIEYRWMLGRGDILVTDVSGGPGSISQAFRDMEHHVQDFRRTAPAIPFQSLVTDRSKEPDTGKWRTRIYWPVM